MSGSVLRDACAKGDMFNMDRILMGAQDFSLMRSPIYMGVQSDGWVRRKAISDIMNDRDKLGQGAIHICIKNNQIEALKKILAVPGLDLNLPGMGNYSPAVLACSKNSGVSLDLLLQNGVDPNQADDAEWTLLHHCTAELADNALEALLQRREVVIDTFNDNGYTPLMMACIKDEPKMIERLIQAGADANIRHELTQESSYDMLNSVDARNAIITGLVKNQERLAVLEKEAEEKAILERGRAMQNRGRDSPTSTLHSGKESPQTLNVQEEKIYHDNTETDIKSEPEPEPNEAKDGDKEKEDKENVKDDEKNDKKDEKEKEE